MLDKYLYEEVYVVGVDHITSASGELTVCRGLESLLVHLGTKVIGVNSDLRVLHGVLTSAKAIPKDTCGKQAFILLADPDDKGSGSVIDSSADDNCEELAAEIESLLSSEEVAPSFIEIDNAFILYGYEINIILSIDEEDIDDGIISSCLDVALRAKELENSEGD
jgi:hypothetical protein